MRHQLETINEFRGTFTGTFERFGTKTEFGYLKETVLLLNIKNPSGQIVADHLWFNRTKGFKSLHLSEGDVLQFDARVKPYVKGYKGWDLEKQLLNPLQKDYKLSHPTKFRKIEMEGIK